MVPTEPSPLSPASSPPPASLVSPALLDPQHETLRKQNQNLPSMLSLPQPLPQTLPFVGESVSTWGCSLLLCTASPRCAVLLCPPSACSAATRRGCPVAHWPPPRFAHGRYQQEMEGRRRVSLGMDFLPSSLLGCCGLPAPLNRGPPPLLHPHRLLHLSGYSAPNSTLWL